MDFNEHMSLTEGSSERKPTDTLGSYQRVRSQQQGFPGSPVVKNLPADAGNMGVIPHALEQLSPYATTIEPVL